jgi:hypothetical protein
MDSEMSSMRDSRRLLRLHAADNVFLSKTEKLAACTQSWMLVVVTLVLALVQTVDVLVMVDV